jgi:restriction system protein
MTGRSHRGLRNKRRVVCHNSHRPQMSSMDTKTRNTRANSQFVQYIVPVVEAIRELGGSGRPDEVRGIVARKLRISEEEQSKPLPSGVQTRFENQVHWARFYLAKAGYLDSSQRGVWTLSEKARAVAVVTPELAGEVVRQVAARTNTAKARPTFSSRSSGEPPEAPLVEAPQTDTDNPPSEGGYREEVATRLHALAPAGFERFCQRLLRESGFQEVTVTGRSGDGGIDGIGILQVNALVSFKVLFQCKRYAGSVTPSQVRDFRGAMAGRADKGIIITTGSFTSDARKERSRHRVGGRREAR